MVNLFVSVMYILVWNGTPFTSGRSESMTSDHIVMSMEKCIEQKPKVEESFGSYDDVIVLCLEEK